MTQQDLVLSVDLARAVKALKDDLQAAGGPRISTIRSYNFAILPYPPDQEFKLRGLIQELTNTLVAEGWHVKSIALHKLLFDRMRAEGPDFIETLIATEKRLHGKAVEQTGNAAEPEPDAALKYLQTHLVELVEGPKNDPAGGDRPLDRPQGIAADVIREIEAFRAEHPDEVERRVVFIGRAGALYPFFRTSALLRHLDGHTFNIPVVLLYPGDRRDVTALSFMGVLEPDRDYRPRIYP